jgi:hypothetical protein
MRTFTTLYVHLYMVLHIHICDARVIVCTMMNTGAAYAFLGMSILVFSSKQTNMLCKVTTELRITQHRSTMLFPFLILQSHSIRAFLIPVQNEPCE